MKTLLLISVILLFLYSCIQPQKPINGPCQVIGPLPFGFVISDSKNEDLFSKQYLGTFPTDSIKIYHKDIHGISMDTILFEKRPDLNAGPNAYYIYSLDIIDKSIAGIKTYYFKRNRNVVDTIYFDETDIKTSRGCHNYMIHSFKYNGVEMTKNNDKLHYEVINSGH